MQTTTTPYISQQSANQINRIISYSFTTENQPKTLKQEEYNKLMAQAYYSILNLKPANYTSDEIIEIECIKTITRNNINNQPKKYQEYKNKNLPIEVIAAIIYTKCTFLNCSECMSNANITTSPEPSPYLTSSCTNTAIERSLLKILDAQLTTWALQAITQIYCTITPSDLQGIRKYIISCAIENNWGLPTYIPSTTVNQIRSAINLRCKTEASCVNCPLYTNTKKTGHKCIMTCLKNRQESTILNRNAPDRTLEQESFITI